MSTDTKTVRPSVDFGSTITRTINTEGHVEYVLGTCVVTLKREGKGDSDNWVASFPCLSGVNKNGDKIATRGYESEKAQPRKSAFDHAFLALGRQLLSFADDCDSNTVAKSKNIAALTSENASLNAKVEANAHAMQIVTGVGDLATTPLTAEERTHVDAAFLAMCDAKLPQEKAA